MKAVVSALLSLSILAIVQDSPTRTSVDATAMTDTFHQSLLPEEEPIIEMKTRQGANTCRTMFDIDTVSIAISF